MGHGQLISDYSVSMGRQDLLQRGKAYIFQDTL